jgi:hypothetical protein
VFDAARPTSARGRWVHEEQSCDLRGIVGIRARRPARANLDVASPSLTTAPTIASSVNNWRTGHDTRSSTPRSNADLARRAMTRVDSWMPRRWTTSEMWARRAREAERAPCAHRMEEMPKIGTGRDALPVR